MDERLENKEKLIFKCLLSDWKHLCRNEHNYIKLNISYVREYNIFRYLDILHIHNGPITNFEDITHLKNI